MRCLIGRALRLELVAAGLGIALTLPALAVPAGQSGLATETSLATATRDLNGITQATLSVSVTGADGLPATGAVVIEDEGKPIAGVELNPEGRATSTITLSPGDHKLTAAYAGDLAHRASASQSTAVPGASGANPDFTVSVAPGSLSLKQGQSGSVIVSVSPINAASLSAPMFVTLSCGGLPDQSVCSFSPQNVQILPTTTAAVTSSLVVTTVQGSAMRSMPIKPMNPVAWCVLLPGAFGLVGIAFGARRRAWLSRLSLLGLLALVTVIGTAGCSPLYNYYNHGPSPNRPTPTGSYTLNVNAQSSNGITAVTHTTTLALTVTQ